MKFGDKYIHIRNSLALLKNWNLARFTALRRRMNTPAASLDLPEYLLVKVLRQLDVCWARIAAVMNITDGSLHKRWAAELDEPDPDVHN